MDAHIYRLIRFILLTICLIPSFICFLLVFFYLIKNREINSKQLQHHVILVLLFCNFILITTELPISLLYSYQGYVKPKNKRFCSFWIAYNNGLYSSGLFLMAFASIERYFLIFHERYVIKWRFIIHYPVILICFIYPLTFYNVIVNIYPCQNVYYYDAYICGGTCFQYEEIAGTLDYLINVVTPTMFIIFANIVLLLRFTYQKRAMRLTNTWRKYRLMYVQLVSISILYFIIWIPFVIISLIRLFYNQLFLQDVTTLIISYCFYICPLASPFISLVGLPGVRQHLRRNTLIMPWISCSAENRIGPTATLKTRIEQQHMTPRREYDEHRF